VLPENKSCFFTSGGTDKNMKKIFEANAYEALSMKYK
jgi:hypothetical protein